MARCPKVSPQRDLDIRLLRLVRQTASGAGLSSMNEGESLTYFSKFYSLTLLFSFSLLPPASVFLSMLLYQSMYCSADDCVALNIIYIVKYTEVKNIEYLQITF